MDLETLKDVEYSLRAIRDYDADPVVVGAEGSTDRQKVRLMRLEAEAALSKIGSGFLKHQDDVAARLEREMTINDARTVRKLRVDDGKTWNRIASMWADANTGWQASQVLGRALCYRAAVLLGEDPHEAPWN